MGKINKNVVLLDLDGTILDSLEGIICGVNYAFKVNGLKEVTTEEFLPYVGPPIVGTFSKNYNLGEERSKKVFEDYQQYYKETGWKQSKVYDGIENLLVQLKSKGKKIAVATNKADYFAKLMIKGYGFDKHIDFICGSDKEKGIYNKTHVIKECLKNLEIDNLEDVVMIGDRVHDVEGAKECGIDSIGITYGYGNKEELEEAGATIIANTTYEVLELF